ncbi:MAG: peroxiredoxin [Dehalococcoidia bacterium]|nr:peroxiredoxin [Dehalococcoidia bacterium]
MSVEVGQAAPDFELAAAGGATIKLSDYSGDRTVLLAFYPRDDTSGCTIEMTTFQQEYARFRSLGAEILGVSADSVDSHDQWCDKLGGLSYPLLADTQLEVIKQYDVLSPDGSKAQRALFVVDRKGTLRWKNESYDVRDPAQYQSLIDALAAAQE